MTDENAVRGHRFNQSPLSAEDYERLKNRIRKATDSKVGGWTDARFEDSFRRIPRVFTPSIVSPRLALQTLSAEMTRSDLDAVVKQKLLGHIERVAVEEHASNLENRYIELRDSYWNELEIRELTANK